MQSYTITANIIKSFMKNCLEIILYLNNIRVYIYKRNPSEQQVSIRLLFALIK